MGGGGGGGGGGVSVREVETEVLRKMGEIGERDTREN